MNATAKILENKKIQEGLKKAATFALKVARDALTAADSAFSYGRLDLALDNKELDVAPVIAIHGGRGILGFSVYSRNICATTSVFYRDLLYFDPVVLLFL